MTENPQIGSFEYFAQLHEVEDKHWWSRGMRDIAGMMLRRQYDGASELDILDAGCGTGVMLSWLQPYSRSQPVEGIDVAEHALRFCRRRGHEQVRKASVEDLPYEDARFDLIVCNDVIQHLTDDRRAMGEFYRVLRPGGCLLVRTNSKQGLDADKPPASDDYRKYTGEELREKTSRAGLHMIQLSHVNMLMSLAPIVKRYVRERGEEKYDDRGLPIRLLPPHLAWLNPLLRGVLKLEARYLADPLRSLPLGNSIIFMAQKPEGSP